MLAKIEALGTALLERVVPSVTADAAAAPGWYHYAQCWQCNNGPWGHFGYNAPCEAYWNGSKFTRGICG
ncbi:hypothetical protein [Streptomyces sp. NPDC047079]|uniref:hypothetical protein n=1 Tax=Streptomyces sp. NPDC047079 TaxID=3154607 RepID=UPI0033C32A0F